MGQVALGAREEPHQGWFRQYRPEHVEAGVALVVEAGDDDGPFSYEREADARRPEQVRRKDDRVIALALPEEVLEQRGHAEQEPHPAHLVVQVRDLAGLYGELCPQRRPARVADDRKAPHLKAIFFG